jgi:hypothetical protein
VESIEVLDSVKGEPVTNVITVGNNYHACLDMGEVYFLFLKRTDTDDPSLLWDEDGDDPALFQIPAHYWVQNGPLGRVLVEEDRIVSEGSQRYGFPAAYPDLSADEFAEVVRGLAAE